MKLFHSLLIHAILIACLFTCLFSQHPGDLKVREGVDAFYNFEYEKSLRILSSARTEYPSHPVVHAVWAAAWYQYDQSQFSEKKVYSNFESRLQKVEKIYDSLAAIHPNQTNYLLFLGTVQSLKARIHLGQKRFLSTFYSAYKGMRMIQKANTGPYQTKDSLLPIGIVEWYSDLSNPILKLAAQSIGVRPSRYKGISKMEISARESEWAWMESMSVLAYIYQFFDLNPEKGLAYMNTLSSKYPDNFKFNIYYCLGLLQTGKINEAEKKLEILDDKLSQQRPFHQKRYRPYISFLWGELYFQKNDHNSSLVYLNQSLKEYDSDMDVVLANVFLLQGKIYDLKNMRYEARQAYKQCIKLKNSTSAIVFAKQYLNEPYKG